MNLKNYPRRTYSIDQFTQPQNTELDGQSFYFVMDDGYDYELSVTGGDTVLWNYVGQEQKKATYQCLKGDDETYILDFELEEFIDKHDRVNHLFVIDLSQRLVTMAVCKIGENPRFPYLVSSKYIFGAIKVSGTPLPLKRHVFTTDMLGTSVQWHWNTQMQTRHNYYTSSFYRITSPANMEEPEPERGSRMTHDLPSADEVAQYIKIKDNLYLFSLVEEKMERALHGQNPGFRSNDMKFLQNYDRMYHVGRTFGNVKEGGPESSSTNFTRCYISFGAFGHPIKLHDDFLNEPNPYAP